MTLGDLLAHLEDGVLPVLEEWIDAVREAAEQHGFDHEVAVAVEPLLTGEYSLPEVSYEPR